MTANVPLELATTSILIEALSGELPPPSITPSIEEINDRVKAVIHTNFLPSLKGTSYELCKLRHSMENTHGKLLVDMSDENDGVAFDNGKNLRMLHFLEQAQ